MQPLQQTLTEPNHNPLSFEDVLHSLVHTTMHENRKLDFLLKRKLLNDFIYQLLYREDQENFANKRARKEESEAFTRLIEFCQKQIGITEIAGKDVSVVILEYIAKCKAKVDEDLFHFADYVLMQSEGTRKRKRGERKLNETERRKLVQKMWDKYRWNKTHLGPKK